MAARVGVGGSGPLQWARQVKSWSKSGGEGGVQFGSAGASLPQIAPGGCTTQPLPHQPIPQCPPIPPPQPPAPTHTRTHEHPPCDHTKGAGPIPVLSCKSRRPVRGQARREATRTQPPAGSCAPTRQSMETPLAPGTRCKAMVARVPKSTTRRKASPWVPTLYRRDSATRLLGFRRSRDKGAHCRVQSGGGPQMGTRPNHSTA
jgi:hypothetical protein